MNGLVGLSWCAAVGSVQVGRVIYRGAILWLKIYVAFTRCSTGLFGWRYCSSLCSSLNLTRVCVGVQRAHSTVNTPEKSDLIFRCHVNRPAESQKMLINYVTPCCVKEVNAAHRDVGSVSDTLPLCYWGNKCITAATLNTHLENEVQGVCQLTQAPPPLLNTRSFSHSTSGVVDALYFYTFLSRGRVGLRVRRRFYSSVAQLPGGSGGLHYKD